MSNKISWSLCLLAVILLLAPAAGFGQAKKPAPTPQAAAPGPQAGKEKIPDPLEIIRRACDFLKKQKEFSFKAEVDYDRVYHGGKKLQFSQVVTAAFQRPDKLRIDGNGDLESKLLLIDGKSLTLYDKYKNHYATIPVSGDFDAALNEAYKKYGLRVGLAELGSKNLCNMAFKDKVHALYAGRHMVRGIPCHHLAFDKKNVHYQVWIDAGKQPLLRKIVVTRKEAPASPQWVAYLSEWNFSPKFAAGFFTFTPPAGALKIKFLPVKPEGPKAPPKEKPKKKGGKS